MLKPPSYNNAFIINDRVKNYPEVYTAFFLLKAVTDR